MTHKFTKAREHQVLGTVFFMWHLRFKLNLKSVLSFCDFQPSVKELSDPGR